MKYHDPAVDLDRLSVRRGGELALREVSWQVPSGCVVGLLGPSGSGKTTLLRAVVGVQVIASGQVRVLGLTAGSSQLRSRVGYQTQSPSVYDDLSVRENLRYFAVLLHRGHDAVERTLDSVDLADVADRQVRTLSGGQRSRVSLAAALVGEPDLLVLDEPTVGLDPVLRRDLWNLFHRLAKAGTTLLVSSHVMDEATRCDRLLILRDGEVVVEDTPQGLLSRSGATDAEHAFLALVERRGNAAEQVRA